MSQLDSNIRVETNACPQNKEHVDALIAVGGRKDVAAVELTNITLEHIGADVWVIVVRLGHRDEKDLFSARFKQYKNVAYAKIIQDGAKRSRNTCAVRARGVLKIKMNEIKDICEKGVSDKIEIKHNKMNMKEEEFGSEA